MSPFDELGPDLRNRFTSYAAALAANVDELAEASVERIRAETPQYIVEVPELAEAVAQGARPSILAELIAMQEDAKLPESCPGVDAEGARLAARFGVPIDISIWIYRVGHLAQWEGWFRLVEDGESDPLSRQKLLAAGSRFFFDYADRMSRWVTEEHTAERDRMLRGREQRRANLVRELLAGRTPDIGELDYDLELFHVGVVAAGSEASEAMHKLARSLDRRLLIVEVGEEKWWAWLGSPEPIDGLPREIPGADELAAGARFAFGTASQGLDGFRLSHREAEDTDAICEATGAQVSHYDEVALQVLASRDRDRAEHFVSRELGGLAGNDNRSRRLRQTLRAYFDADQNAASTASALGVHQQTVAQRLRAVEERTGRPVAERRAELDVALRIYGAWLRQSQQG